VITLANDIAVQAAIDNRVNQLKNTIRGLGWEVIAQDTRGDDITVTATIPRETIVGVEEQKQQQRARQ
jgi:hypothetical protein